METLTFFSPHDIMEYFLELDILKLLENFHEECLKIIMNSKLKCNFYQIIY